MGDPLAFLALVARLPPFCAPLRPEAVRAVFELAHEVSPLDAWATGCAALAVWVSGHRPTYEAFSEEVGALTQFARSAGGLTSDGQWSEDQARTASAALESLAGRYGGPPVGLVAAYRAARLSSGAGVAPTDKRPRGGRRTPEETYASELASRVPRSAARPSAHCRPCGRRRVFMSLGEAGWRCLTCGGDA